MRRLKKSMALLLALAMILTTFGITTVSAAGFNDISGHWAESVIEKWSNAGVVNGYEDGTFLPDEDITRAELAKIISTAKEYTALADISFADVSADDWYYEDLRKCVAQGVIGGYEDDTFRPENAVTREEAATMFQRAYKINTEGLLSFTDTDSISEWAKTSITALVGAGVINGYEDGSFAPAASITRAEVVKILDGITDAEAADSSNANPNTSDVSTDTVGLGYLGGSGSGVVSGGGSSSGGTTGYTVSFYPNGGTFGTSASAKSISVTKNSVIGGNAPTPERDGYLFDGWYTSQAAANQLIAGYKWDLDTRTVTQSVSLYAGWYQEGSSVVTFELNGGTVPEDTELTEVVENNDVATEPSFVPERANYTFNGWYTSNGGSTKFNFAATPIKKDTTIYAGWTVDAAYAAQEITFPTTTTGSYLNGTVEAYPPSAIPGETVVLNIIAPDGYEVSGIRSIIYTSTDDSKSRNLEVTEDGGVYSFVLPADVENGTIVIDARFLEPTPTAVPTATPDPNATPTPEVTPSPTPVVPTYYFETDAVSALGGTFPANTEIEGLTISAASDVTDSSKTFEGTGFKYSKVCKVKKATVSFNVIGACTIKIDAVNAGGSGSADRKYTVYADGTKIGEQNCVVGETPTCTIDYTGGAAKISFSSSDGINLYGIWVEYDPSVTPTPAPTPTASPTPEPTIDPNIQYDIKTEASSNGTLSASAAKAKMGEKITVTTVPASGYQTARVTADKSVTVAKTAENTYTFVMPQSDITISADFVSATAAEYTATALKTDNGTVSIERTGVVAAADEDTAKLAASSSSYVIDSSDNFLMADKNGGKWIVSSDGTVGSTVTEDATDIGGNSSAKMKLTDKAVQYVLDTPATEGEFVLSYDYYQASGSGRSFRTYLDNAAHDYSESSGQALASGNTNSFFHMMDVGSKVYYTTSGGDAGLTSVSGTATQIGTSAIENSKWYRVVISGELGTNNPVTVAFYEHGTDGAYNPNNISTIPTVITTTASFTDDRDPILAQIKFMRTASGTLYYDNIKLSVSSDVTLNAYTGEQIKITATPDEFYQVGSISVVDASGNAVALASDNTFYMPASDVTITTVFSMVESMDTPANLAEITEAYTFIADDWTENGTKGIDAKSYLDENRVYAEKALTVANNKKTSTINGEEHNNSIDLKMGSRYIIFKPAYDATISVYVNCTNDKRTLGVGNRTDAYNIVSGPMNQSVYTFTVSAHQLVVMFGLEKSGDTFSGGDVYIAGFTVTPTASLTSDETEEISEIEAVDADVPEEEELEAELDAESTEDADVPSPSEASDDETEEVAASEEPNAEAE